MEYIESSNIVVFPCANRSEDYNLQSRVMSEYNMTNIINQLTERDSFVISDTVDTGIPFEFNIHGYYFCVADYSKITEKFTGETDNKIYAVISINEQQKDNVIYKELAIIPSEQTSLDDSNGMFCGLGFVSSVEEPSSYYKLLILEKHEGLWVIPKNSKIKFTSKFSVLVDDGDLDE